MSLRISRSAGVVLVLAGLMAASARADGPRLLHTPPSEAPAGKPLRIEGELVDADQVDHLTLYYRRPHEAFRSVPMTLQYGEYFRGWIPGSEVVPPGLEYYVEGVTFSGAQVAVFASEERPERVIVRGARETAREERPPERRHRTEPPLPPPVTRRSETPAAQPLEPVGPEGGETRTAGPSAGTTARRSPTPRPGPAQPSTEKQPRRARRASTISALFHHRSQLEVDLAVYSATPPGDALGTASKEPRAPTARKVVFDRAEIRALGARTVFDVLDVVPGLTVSRGVQGFYRTAVRGLRDAPGLLFLLDGHRLNDIYDGRALANLPVDNLERIEVTLGPGGPSDRVGAFLGVVNLVTRTDDGANLALEAGSFSAFAGHLQAAHHFGALKLSVDGDLSHQVGDRLAIQQDALSALTEAQGRDPSTPSGYTDDHRFFANVGLTAALEGGAGTFTASVRMLDESRGALIGQFDTVGPGSNLGWRVFLADLGWHHRFGQRFELSFRAYGNLQLTDRLFHVGPNDFDTGPPDDAARIFPDGVQKELTSAARTLGVVGRGRVRLAEGNRLGFGARFESQVLTGYGYLTNFDASYLPRPLTRPDGLRYPAEVVPGVDVRPVLGIWAEDVWSLGSMLTLDFGFRVDALKLPKPAAPSPSWTASFDPRAGIAFRPTDDLTLRLTYGHAFRPPTVKEYGFVLPDTYFTHGQFEGNPSLVPASVDTVALGGSLIRPVGDRRLTIDGEAYYELLTKPIEAVDDSGNIIPLSNREGVRVIGAEGSARLALSARARIWVNASWFRAEDLETPPLFQLLTDTPQARFNAGVELPLGRWLDFDVVAKLGAERRNLSRTPLEQTRRYSIPAYGLVDAQLRTERLFGHFELALVGHNVFDVERFDDVPRPDRIPGLLPLPGASLMLRLRAFE